VAASKRHYDFTVNSMAEVGGFLYGLLGRYEFMKKNNTLEGWSLELEISNRKTQLLYKAVEFDDSIMAAQIKKQLWPIITGFNDVHEMVNKQLFPDAFKKEQA
jgi:hypothetical protein